MKTSHKSDELKKNKKGGVHKSGTYGLDDNSLTTEYPKPCSALEAPVCFPVIKYFKLHIYILVLIYTQICYQGRIQDLWLGGVSRRGVWGQRPQRVQGRALVGDPGGEAPPEALGI